MSRLTRTVLIAAILGVLLIPAHVAAAQQNDSRYPYIAIDLGTLGGPSTYGSDPGPWVTDSGAVLGEADTTTSDPDYASMTNLLTGNNTQNVDPNISHAVVWRNGVLTDLGAPPGNNVSEPFEANARGDVAGVAENGATDPLLGYPEGHAVVWKDGRLVDLGTLGGNESFGTWINDRGQVVGSATNAIPDPFIMFNWFPAATQWRAFLWQDGSMRDLGTLGGPDSQADYINDRGQVAGQSFTNATINATTGIPTEHPFLWQDGHMQDLGTLGGTVALPTYDGSGGLNERGEVIGLSFLSGDRRFHPFLWDNGRMQDLGTLGGVVGLPTNINQAGDVVGWTLMTGNRTAHAFLWTDKNGLQDLGTLAGQPCSYADGINARGQIVGGSCTGPNGDEGDGWVWQDGALRDLNDMIAPSSSLTQIRQANTINDRGEIAAVGIVNGHKHVILLAPSELAESEGLRSNLPVSATGATAAGRSSTSVQVNLLPLLGRSRSRWSYLPAG